MALAPGAPVSGDADGVAAEPEGDALAEPLGETPAEPLGEALGDTLGEALGDGAPVSTGLPVSWRQTLSVS